MGVETQSTGTPEHLGLDSNLPGGHPETRRAALATFLEDLWAQHLGKSVPFPVPRPGPGPGWDTKEKLDWQFPWPRRHPAPVLVPLAWKARILGSEAQWILPVTITPPSGHVLFFRRGSMWPRAQGALVGWRGALCLHTALHGPT